MAVAYPPTRKYQGGESRTFTHEELDRIVSLGILQDGDRWTIEAGQVCDRFTGRSHLWTRDQARQLAESLILDPTEKVELLEGEIVHKMSQNRPHVIAIWQAAKALETAFDANHSVEQQPSLGVEEHSEPEPDLFVIRGTPGDYEQHPTPEDAVLVVEVAVTSLRIDRGWKSRIYARAGVQDYWILNLNARCLEVRREPGVLEDGGDGYRDVQTLGEGDSVSPLAAPEARIKVSDLLPPKR